MNSILRFAVSRVLEADPDATGSAGDLADTKTTVDPPAAAKQESPKVDPGVQKRINEMTYKYREQERRAQAAEAKIAEYEERERKAKEPAPEAEKRKTLADFDFDDVAYEDYLAERVTQRASKTAAEQATKAVEERELKKAQETTAATRAAKWKTAAEAFAKDHPDFAERVYGPDLHFTDAVSELLTESDLGPQLAYHLAQNPDELSRIARLPPAAAGREIGKLEVKLTPAEAPPKEETDADETARAQAPPATTKAPPPPPKLQPVANSSTRPLTTSPLSDKLGDEEWMKAENKRLAAKRAGK
jgi:hypothetical protein